MGSIYNKSWYEITIWVIMILNLSFFSSESVSIPTNKTTHIKSNSLDDFLYSYWAKSIAKRPHSGVSYNISLQASNYSGIEVSVLRLRSSTLWAKGVNFRSFVIPPRLITKPHVKRVAIMYQNLGNISSNFYDLPGFKSLTSVVGLAVYDATDLRREASPKRLNATLMGKPVRVKFEVPKGRDANLLKCARFGAGPSSSRLVELSNMVSHGVCSSKAIGKFAIFMPILNNSTTLSSMPSLPGQGRRKLRQWAWWVIGVGAGFSGLIFVVSIALISYRPLASRKMKIMEAKSVKGESLGTIWIGSSKLPVAPMTRTQPVNVEMDLAP